MMTLNEYQKMAGATNKGTRVAVIKTNGSGHPAVEYEVFGMYNALGCAGEAGELAEKVKKYARDEAMDYDTTREGIKKEAGDVLWYLGQLAADWDLTLQEIAEANLAKLADREARGVLGGSGDNR